MVLPAQPARPPAGSLTRTAGHGRNLTVSRRARRPVRPRLHARAGRPLWGGAMPCSEKGSLWDVGVSRVGADCVVSQLFAECATPRVFRRRHAHEDGGLAKPHLPCLSCQPGGRAAKDGAMCFCQTPSPDLSNVLPCPSSKVPRPHPFPPTPAPSTSSQLLQKRGKAASSTKAV